MNDIGAIITRLAPFIEKKVRSEVNLVINLQQEAQTLSSTLIEIQKLLEEAENRRLTDPRVRSWLEKLEEITYEIDDELDRFETVNLQHQIEGITSSSSHDDDDDDINDGLWEKVCAFVEFICLAFGHVRKRRDIGLKIKELNEKVEGLAKETEKYSMIPIIHDSNTRDNNYKTQVDTAFCEVCENLESQEKMKNTIVEKLVTGPSEELRLFKSRVGDEDPEPSLQTISLIGLGGIGKTTLARLVYNDKKVEKAFGLKSWIWVSNQFDEVRIARAILESLGVDSRHVSEFQELLKLIKSTLIEYKKNFLLVLDDVWIQDDKIWNQLKASLGHGASGSRILITTRNENVARLMGSNDTVLDVFFGPQQFIPIKPLSDEDCESLFVWFAFGGGSYGDDRKRDIGWRLAKKCRGLPIAAKTLGNYLQSRKSTKLWEKVLGKEIYELEEVAKPIFNCFALSYNELPLALKRCFSYCAVFPKEDLVDGWIDVNELLRIWGVQGYLGSSGIENEMELKGLDYIERLQMCNLLELQKNVFGNSILACRMHGLLHDFTRFLVKTSRSQKQRSFFSKENLPLNEVSSLKSARVLSLTGEDIKELPHEIGSLIHLRLLNLERASIEKLPGSLCDFCNLQSLDLRDCYQLSTFPEEIHKLRNLRLLLIKGATRLDLKGLKKLAWIRTLDEFNVRSRDNLQGLRKLNQLQGSLHIVIQVTMNEEADIAEAKKAALEEKTYLSNLTLDFHKVGFEVLVSLEVMEALKAPPNLQTLTLQHYRGVEFPRWIFGSYLSKLRTLEIQFCENCTSLPPFGTLPSLEEFSVNSIKSLKSVGLEFLGNGFPNLKMLGFFFCTEWEEWNDVSEQTGSPSIMPCLESLTISDCPKLKGLPHRLLREASSLRVLNIQKSSRLSERYSREDWPHIRYVTIN